MYTVFTAFMCWHLIIPLYDCVPCTNQIKFCSVTVLQYFATIGVFTGPLWNTKAGKIRLALIHGICKADTEVDIFVNIGKKNKIENKEKESKKEKKRNFQLIILTPSN